MLCCGMPGRSRRLRRVSMAFGKRSRKAQLFPLCHHDFSGGWPALRPFLQPVTAVFCGAPQLQSSNPTLCAALPMPDPCCGAACIVGWASPAVLHIDMVSNA